MFVNDKHVSSLGVVPKEWVLSIEIISENRQVKPFPRYEGMHRRVENMLVDNIKKAVKQE